jgi:hypothetical protein
MAFLRLGLRQGKARTRYADGSGRWSRPVLDASAMTEQPTTFFLIVADLDQGFFSVEGPMTDDRPWQNGARDAREQFGSPSCAARPDRIGLDVEFQSAEKLAGVPPGSIRRRPTGAIGSG